MKDDFHVDSKYDLRRIERQVEEEYVSNLRTSCFKEKSYSKYPAIFFHSFESLTCILCGKEFEF